MNEAEASNAIIKELENALEQEKEAGRARLIALAVAHAATSRAEEVSVIPQAIGDLTRDAIKLPWIINDEDGVPSLSLPNAGDDPSTVEAWVRAGPDDPRRAHYYVRSEPEPEPLPPLPPAVRERITPQEKIAYANGEGLPLWAAEIMRKAGLID